MIRRASECSIKVNENMKGGDGSVKLTSFISGPEELLNKGRLFSHIVLEKDCEIGWHVHHGEGEAYYILKGSGEYSDNGTIVIGEARLYDPQYEIIEKQFWCISDYLNWTKVFSKSYSANKPTDLHYQPESLAEIRGLAQAIAEAVAD